MVGMGGAPQDPVVRVESQQMGDGARTNSTASLIPAGTVRPLTVSYPLLAQSSWRCSAVLRAVRCAERCAARYGTWRRDTVTMSVLLIQ